MLKVKTFFFLGDYEIFFSAPLPPIYSDCINLKGQKGEINKQDTMDSCLSFYTHR